VALRSASSSGGKLVDELVNQGKLTKEYGQAVKIRYRTNPEVVSFLLESKKIKEEDLVKASSVIYDLPLVHLVGKNIDRSILSIIPETVAQNFHVIAYEQDGNTLKIAVGKPYNLIPSIGGPLHELEQKRGLKISLSVTTSEDIAWALKGYKTPAAPATTSFDSQVMEPLVTPTVPNVHLDMYTIPSETLRKFPEEIAQKYKMVVFAESGPRELKVAAVDPTNPKSKEIIEFIEKKNNITIDLYKTSEDGFARAMQGYSTPTQPAPAQAPVSPQPTVTATSAAPASSENAVASPAAPAPGPRTADLPGYQQVAPKVPAPAERTAAPKTNQPEVPIASSGHSPATGGKTKEGVLIIGEKEIMPALAGVTSPLADSANLEERNLDTFLGELVTTVNGLAEIVKSGFIPKTVAAILSYGIFLKASDIHLEPLKDAFRLRYRVDGELREYLYMPLSLQPPITSRIKIFSNLKIDEQRIPQDGRYDAVANKHEFDVRVSSLPTVHGEKIVMRLLDKSSGAYTLEQLGFAKVALEHLIKELEKPYGVVLATGPTGSGKSTTLYAILNRIANPKVNVITLEDPVEYDMKGINQVQVKPKIGFSFAEGLRSILRQDPNIIMVGEIRDGETAELATHAALTGHLVLSTLHTNNAAGALPRLINMGVEPFLITSALNAIIAQRLVRKLCPDCKQPVKIPEPVMAKVKDIMTGVGEFKPENVQFFGPKGCDKCHNGFSGRVGVYEVLVMSDKIEEAAIKEASANDVEKIAKAEGMYTMQQDGILKALQGVTTLDEVFKVTTDD
jgi:type II secretory ATPase GspE/PulE/Tfp pilus assembly ATPase PilB-like protein